MQTVAEFKKLPWRRQNEILRPHVLATLESLKTPLETKRVMLEVAHRAGWLNAYHDYLPGAAAMVGVVLARFARHEPGWAKQDGETFMFAGKTCRRWVWRPQQGRSEAERIADLMS